MVRSASVHKSAFSFSEESLTDSGLGAVSVLQSWHLSMALGQRQDFEAAEGMAGHSDGRDSHFWFSLSQNEPDWHSTRSSPGTVPQMPWICKVSGFFCQMSGSDPKQYAPASRSWVQSKVPGVGHCQTFASSPSQRMFFL